MQKLKDELSNKIGELPSKKEDYYDEANAESYPSIIETIGGGLNQVFDRDTLIELLQDDDKSFDFIIIVTELISAFKPFNDWFEINKDILDKTKLSSTIRERALKVGNNLEYLSKDLEVLKQNKDSLIGQINDLKKYVEEKETKELEYKNLRENEERMKRRRKELQELEQAVKEGKLKELEADNVEKGKQLSEAENKLTSLLARRDELLKKQKDTELDSQKIIDQTVEVGKTDVLYKELREKSTAHNKILLELQRRESEDLSINLNFTEETSKGLMDSSMNEKIKQAKRLIEEVETALKQKI